MKTSFVLLLTILLAACTKMVNSSDVGSGGNVFGSGITTPGSGGGNLGGTTVSSSASSLTADMTGPATASTSPFFIMVIFNATVSGLNANSFEVTNGTAGTPVNNGNNTYSVPITPISVGTVTVQLPADAVGNVASNILSVSYSISNGGNSSSSNVSSNSSGTSSAASTCSTVSCNTCGPGQSLIGGICGTTFCGGSGPSTDPYLICTAGQLQNVSSYPSSHFKVMDNIDLNTLPLTNGTNLAPLILSSGGVFDGNGYTISNLQQHQGINTYAGFFGWLVGTVQNLTLANININVTNPAQLVGGLAGLASLATVNNCVVNGSITASSTILTAVEVGGLIGNMGNSTISLSSFSGTLSVTAAYYGLVGGLVGDVEGTVPSTITTSYANATLSAVSYPLNSYVGGLVSIAAASAMGTTYQLLISNSYARGTLTGNNVAGLLAGTDSYSPVVIENSYAVTSLAGSVGVWGLVPNATSLNNTGQESVTVTNSYYGETSNNQQGLGEGLTNAEMLAPSSYLGWSDSTWLFQSGQYPLLQ